MNAATKPKIHAHRGGARGRYGDNTRAAIAHGLGYDIDGVEVDLCVTRDAEIVLHHDLDCGGVPIMELTLAELRAEFDDGELLTLTEFMELMFDTKKTLNLELKSGVGLTPPAEEYISLLIKTLPQHYKNLFIQSFDWELMKVLKQTVPEIKVGFTHKLPFTVADADTVKNLGGEIFSCNYKGVTESLVNMYINSVWKFACGRSTNQPTLNECTTSAWTS